MEDETFLTLTHATERDIDLLLIEELQCSQEFVKWLFEKVSDRHIENSAVAHSKRRIHNRREIDITLTIEGASGTTIVLIENKLDTQEQPRQAESYREEARSLISNGRANAVFTILVCPRQYAKTANVFASKFDHVVTYEDISDFFIKRATQTFGELASRMLHRRALMDQATTKARRGYQAVPLIDIDRFLGQYVALLAEESIDLKPGSSMLKEGHPGESRTMIFARTELPKWSFLPKIRLVHQLRAANANICLSGWGDHFSEIEVELAADLKGTAYKAVPTINNRVGGFSGLMIVAATPAVDSLASFDDQRQAILNGANITAQLKRWFWSNRSLIEKWANIIPSIENKYGDLLQ